MNRLLNLTFSTALGIIGGSLCWSQAAYAQTAVPYGSSIVPMLSVPVTGGQFKVDLNIQNGVVQNYSYTNNQLPTLLTPVGTINVTEATLPSFGWRDTRSMDEIMRTDIPPNPIAGVNLDSNPKPISAIMQVTGSTQLNDGRNAIFKNTNAFLYGNTTATSPFPIESIGTATEPNAVAYDISSSIPSIYRSLPNTYQGTIQMDIQQGAVMVPQAAFSAAQNSQIKLSIASGKHPTRFSPNVMTRIAPLRSGTQPLVEESFSFNLQDQKITSSSNGEMVIFSPNGEMDLTIKNIAHPVYPAIYPLVLAYDGTIKSADIWTGVVNGNVTLANGQKLNVQNRLITFYSQYSNPEQSTIAGGDLYVDSNAIVPPPTPVAAPAPTPIAQSIAAPTPDPQLSPTPDPQLSILTDTAIADQIGNTSTESSIARPVSNLPSQNTIADIAASPLSSSRIFPDMGALR